MKIAIDGGSLCPPDPRLKLGVYRVVLGFLKGLTKIDSQNKYLIYGFDPLEKEVQDILGNNFTSKTLKPSLFWLKGRVSIELFRDHPQLFLAFSQALPVFKNCKSIGFIHGLAFNKYPQFYPDSVKHLEAITIDLIKRCEHIVVSSEKVKKDIYEIYKRRENIHFIPFGVEEYFLAPTKPRTVWYRGEGGLPNKDNYILYVGGFNMIKNIPLLLRAFDIVRRNRTGEGLYLYLVGSDFWLDPQIEMTIRKLKIGSFVKNFGFLENKDLIPFYRRAKALVLPSFYEGFAFPVWEALACKTPVVSSGGALLPEFSDFVYPAKNDPESMAETIISVLKNKDQKKSLAGFAKAKELTWTKAAKELLGLMGKIHPS